MGFTKVDNAVFFTEYNPSYERGLYKTRTVITDFPSREVSKIRGCENVNQRNKVYDLAGKLHQSSRGDMIDLQLMNDEIYLVRIYDNNTQVNLKLIKR